MPINRKCLCLAIGVTVPLLLDASGIAQTCTFSEQQIKAEVVLSANDYVPLRDMIEWVRARYGWLVNYEDPIFQENHLVDIAIPSWRQKHPGQRGYLVPKRHFFQARFSSPTEGAHDEERVLQSIVSQYNTSQTTIHFAVIKGIGDRYTVYGEDAYRGSGGVAGAKIRINDELGINTSSEAGETIRSCSAQSPVPFTFGTVDQNALNAVPRLKAHRQETCRVAIERLVMQMGPTLVYEIREDIMGSVMAVNIISAEYRDGSRDCPKSTQLGKTNLPSQE